MNYPNKYVVFDFETTGFDPKECKILEIGAIKVVPGVPDTEFTAILNWGVEIPEKITEITGITQEMADAGSNPEEVKKNFLDFIGSDILVGHNIYNFDLKFLKNFVDATHYNHDELMLSFIDTAVLMKAKKMNEAIKFNELFHQFSERIMSQRIFGIKFNLGLCCDELGIPKAEGQHRAMFDVRLTNEVYKKLCLA
ncbi:MAG TPA: 3'-5' exonuclease [Chryseolinea sp.]